MSQKKYLGAEKITFSLKPEGHTYGPTDISNYRVALLLKMQNKSIFE